LADAVVTFSPVAPGSPSSGKTDSDGKYILVYVRKVKGVETGEHIITISTFQEGDPDAGTTDVPEKVPLKYRNPGELKKTVNRGSNTIDFDLEPGPVEEPKPEKGKGKKKIETGCF
jgi:hypothetical protein